MIELLVNGEPRTLDGPLTVETLVEVLACGQRGVAVAVNSTVVTRNTWADTVLMSGDTVEVLHAMQGG